MSAFVMFWLAKPLVDFLLVVLGLIAVGIFHFPAALRRARCKHDGAVRETSACDAICAKCGKNLGFIGAWRKTEGGAQ
jgi:hypothetical protein